MTASDINRYRGRRRTLSNVSVLNVCSRDGGFVTNFLGTQGTENFGRFSHFFLMDGMMLGHKELRVALRFARKEIVKLNFGKKDTPLIRMIDRTLDEAKSAAIMAGESKIPGAAKMAVPTRA